MKFTLIFFKQTFKMYAAVPLCENIWYKLFNGDFLWGCDNFNRTYQVKQVFSQ